MECESLIRDLLEKIESLGDDEAILRISQISRAIYDEMNDEN